MENEDTTQQTLLMPTFNGPVALFTILLTLGVLIMLPTASALYYSKCLNVSLLMGFGIVFSSLITGLFSMLLPGIMRGYLRNTTLIAWGFVTIYTVIVQIIGGCKFS
tara:strand:- start:13912 stop:14232 length:321 start_codon:yes stop_codon:yes gene_type:complete